MLPQMRQSQIKLTYQDYLLLPEDRHYELIEGDFFMTPSPLSIHQMISNKLSWLLNNFIFSHAKGVLFAAPMDVYLSEENVVQPDLFFISREREHIIQRECIKGAPDLVIEILSPSNSNRDLIVKKHLYAKFAVQEYWIVNPETQVIEVMTWAERGFETVQIYPRNATLSSPFLKDIRLRLEEVFEK
ncbi:MAG: Uma2 family endonuclease [Deltaproteobacteria bacterium]|nr:Uma2 family endonuclease [Deltaproteobacteria bacterium]